MSRLIVVVLVTIPMAAQAQGMPQLNFRNPLTTSQVIWMFVIFFVFYLLIAHWGLPRVASVLEERESAINADLEAARLAKEQSDHAVTELLQTTAHARAEAQAAIAASADKVKQEAAAKAQQTQ
ncbi:MAG: F0F1 ATP synthase subunit B', partial [Acetobacteraceae bacterium]|nr:F0F1 ATP synthase subunit B' [Acetobacteraceae bacterium]